MIKLDVYSHLLAIIRNGLISNKRVVSVRKKKRLINFIEKLFNEGIISGFEDKNDLKIYKILLHYNEFGVSRIRGCVRISTPSRRIYVNVKDLQKIKQKSRVFFLSTMFGVLTDSEALYKNIGGELLCVFY